ncbi:MAG: serine/threonine protein kinase [Planctomycetes bacterium]|nr:serine/threonine protein kinase [Planctomycetota bacterium]
MYAFMQCVAEAVMEKGIRGLTEMVPGSNYLLDVASDALKRYKEQRNREQIREDLRRAAEATLQEARAAAEKIARETADGAESAAPLELYLAQIPGAVRRSLRRPEDPSGTTIPANLRLETPADLVRRLPQQLPRFHAGQALPGRPGRTLVEPLGTGGFGEVWRVDHQYAHPWAVKFCIDPRARELLRHEAKHVAQVSRLAREQKHPHVVPLLEAELDSDFPWLAYELITDGDLTGLMLGWQSKPIEERVKVATAAIKTLAETTGHFHTLTDSRGAASPVVHRDLKPGNILVQKRGNGKPKLMITDFGISDIVARVHTQTPTKPTAVHVSELLPPGTCSVVYARLQQQRGDPSDPRDDVHALGVIGYQMLTGRLDVAPPPRFDRELRDIGVPGELIDLLGDCIDHNETRQPANGLVLSKRFPLKAIPPSPPPGGQPVYGFHSEPLDLGGDPPEDDHEPEEEFVPPTQEPPKEATPEQAAPGEKNAEILEDEPATELATPQPPLVASILASGILGAEAALCTMVAAFGVYLALFDENIRVLENIRWVVLFCVVMMIASLLNWYFGREQPVPRRFRAGICSAIILIYFAFALTSTTPPGSHAEEIDRDYSLTNTFIDRAAGARLEEKWNRIHEEDRRRPFIRGGYACVLQVLLTLWFIGTRSPRPKPTKSQLPDDPSHETRF